MGNPLKSETAKKLAILLPQLIGHNAEHADDLDKWIISAETDGCGAAAKEMKKAQTLMRKIGDHLTLAAGSVCATRPVHDNHGHAHPHSHSHSHGHTHDHHH